MYLQSLTTLKRVADEGSYTRAAATLFISQPSVSQHIRQLERAFGAQLIEIVGRRPELTEAGKQVYELACEMESRFELTRQRVDELIGRSLRVVTVVSHTAPLLHRLPPVLRRYWLQHPEISIKTVNKSGHEITDAVKAGVAHIGIQTDAYLDTSLEAIPAWRDSVVGVSAKDHPLADASNITASEISHGRVIVCMGGEIRRLIEVWFQSHGAQLQDVMEVSSFEQVRTAALEGLGVGFLPSYVVLNDLDSGLSQLDIDDFRLSRGTYVIFRKGVHEPARKLIDMMVESAEKAAADSRPEEGLTAPAVLAARTV